MSENTERARYSESDVANGQTFIEMYKDKILYDHTFDEWRIWDGKRWMRDQRGQIWEMAKEVSMTLYEAAEASGAKELRRRATELMKLSGLRNMLGCARTHADIAVTTEQWDSDPYLFNVQNGTLDLRTGTLREHRPGDRLTLMAGCAYEPEATAPQFLSCLNLYWPDHDGADRGIADFMILTMGYCLSGLNDEKCFLLLHGTGDTGKTTIMKALEATWGEYFRTADWSTFAHSREGDMSKHRTDLVRLVGARIVSASEGDEGAKMSEGVIKRVTGRAPLVVRDLMSKPFSFQPTFKIWLDTNHLPRFRGQDQAMWNRVKLISFRRVITRDEQLAFRSAHGSLDALLAAEASGILNLALRGWKLYQERGTLVIPTTITEATSTYRAIEDSLGQFMEERCIVDADVSVEKTELFAQFSEWQKENMEYAVSAKRFGMWMRERGFAEVRTAMARSWRGITVKETRQSRAMRVGIEKLPPPADR